MICFVPIAEHGFAFLDTVTMHFVSVDGEEVFSSLADLREAIDDNHAARVTSAMHGKARGLDRVLTDRLVAMAAIGVVEHAALIDPPEDKP